jgi:hypothetical protein
VAFVSKSLHVAQALLPVITRGPQPPSAALSKRTVIRRYKQKTNLV